MTTIEIMKQRYSVRKYQDRAVEPEKLAQILEAAHVAPSAANLQPVRILVVQSKEGLKKLGRRRPYTMRPWPCWYART